MTDLATELAHPRGRYGVDGDYSVIPAPVALAGYLLLCLATTVFAGLWLSTGRTAIGVGAAVVAAALIIAGFGIRRFSRKGKFEVWARLLSGLGLRGDERVLDLGCGRGAVLLAAAKLIPRGRAVGVDIWRADQTGNSMQATLANADVEGVADRVELHTRDMTDLAIPRRLSRSRRQQPRDPQSARQHGAACGDSRGCAGAEARRPRRACRHRLHAPLRGLASAMRHGGRRASKPRLARLVGAAAHPHPRRHRREAIADAVSRRRLHHALRLTAGCSCAARGVPALGPGPR